MKRIATAVFMAALLAASAAGAEVRSVQICQNKTLSASTTTDCTYTDISGFKFFSFQVYCGETTGNSMSVTINWIGGSAMGATYMAVPLNTAGTAMSALKTAYTTEDAWSAVQSIQPPVSPVGSIRFLELNGDDDIVCSVILNMGD